MSDPITRLTTPITLTRAAIRAANPCVDGWRELLAYCDTHGIGETITLTAILDSNGLDDALWALQCVQIPPSAVDWRRLLAADYAERVLPIYEARDPEDPRPRHAIATGRRYACVLATAAELAAARDAGVVGAAWVASASAAGAASAAWDAACWAAWAAGRDAGVVGAAGAAGAVERAWQTDRLRMYATGWVPNQSFIDDAIWHAARYSRRRGEWMDRR